jgi:hypothetical protein
MSENTFTIDSVNLERFLSAQTVRPALTFDEWIDMLFKQAHARRAPKRRGRPPGLASGPGTHWTGFRIRPYLAKVMLSRKGYAGPSADIIQSVEQELSLSDYDREVVSAGVARWRHYLQTDVSNLRLRGYFDRDSTRFWKLTAQGVEWAKELWGRHESVHGQSA